MGSWRKRLHNIGSKGHYTSMLSIPRKAIDELGWDIRQWFQIDTDPERGTLSVAATGEVPSYMTGHRPPNEDPNEPRDPGRLPAMGKVFQRVGPKFHRAGSGFYKEHPPQKLADIVAAEKEREDHAANVAAKTRLRKKLKRGGELTDEEQRELDALFGNLPKETPVSREEEPAPLALAADAGPDDEEISSEEIDKILRDIDDLV